MIHELITMSKLKKQKRKNLDLVKEWYIAGYIDHAHASEPTNGWHPNNIAPDAMLRQEAEHAWNRFEWDLKHHD